MLLRAIKGHDYDNKWRNSGDQYEASNNFAIALIATGFAERAREGGKDYGAPLGEPMGEEGQPGISEISPRTGKPKRTYNRRDMVPKK